MGEAYHVRQDEFLALDIDVIDIVAVDDQAPADADEQVAVGAELLAHHILHLTELIGQHPRLVVGLHQVTVVAVRRDEHYLVGGDAHQVGGGGYDEILLQHDAAKVNTSWRCKGTKSDEMYEMGGFMYEL